MGICAQGPACRSIRFAIDAQERGRFVGAERHVETIQRQRKALSARLYERLFACPAAKEGRSLFVCRQSTQCVYFVDEKKRSAMCSSARLRPVLFDIYTDASSECDRV